MIKIKLVDLLTALQTKKVRLRAWSANSFKETALHFENNGEEIIYIDITRYGLTSFTHKTQIIGLSHPIESGPNKHILLLEPGQGREFVLFSRCLDKSGKPPDTGTEYEIVPNLLAGYVVELLRRGADQGEVWNTIKSHKGEIVQRLQITAMIDKSLK